MPVFVIPGNHDRRDNFRAGLQHLPGVTTDPHYVQYAVEDHPGSAGHAGHAGAGRRPRRTARRAAGIPRSHPGRGARQADHDRHAPSAVRLRHRPHGPHQPAQRRRSSPRSSPGTGRSSGSSAATTTGPSSPAWRTPSRRFRLRSPIRSRCRWTRTTPAPFVFEPPAFQLHRWTPADGIVSHTVYVEDFPGPFPFLNDPEYPGAS